MLENIDLENMNREVFEIESGTEEKKEELEEKTYKETIEILDKEEMKESCKKDLKLAMQKGDNIYSYFSLATERGFLKDIIPSFSKGLELAMQKGKNVNDYIEIAIENNFLQEIEIDIYSFSKGLNLRIQKGDDIDSYIEIAKQNNFLKDIIPSFSKGLEFRMQKGGDINDYISLATERGFLKDIFKNSIKNCFENISKLKIDNVEIIEKIKKVISNNGKLSLILNSILKNQESLDNLNDNLENNPFFIDIIFENSRYAFNLINQWDKLDDISHTKIKLAYNIHKSILESDPDIDVHSLEYRKLYQKKLLSFDRNKEILEEIKESDIDTDAWLNYNKRENFILYNTTDIPFSQKISTPLDRITKNTIQEYSNIIKDILNTNKELLEDKKIEINSNESEKKQIEEAISKMDKKYSEEKDENKKQKIQKSINDLKQKLDFKKEIFINQKILNDLDSINLLSKTIVSKNEELIKFENELNTLKGDELNQIKSSIGRIRKDILDLINKLNTRKELFERELESNLIKALGEKKSKELIQEINTRKQEMESHFKSDINNLKSLFKKDGENIENNEMSLELCSRYPSEYLFMGNYTTCCISIESGAGNDGCTSAITDYNTDLGIQILQIKDKTKDLPVVAAWLYISKTKDNKTAIVIDNIEANEDYSSRYQFLFASKIFTYLEEYAKSTGVDELLMGINNNDVKPKNIFRKYKQNLEKLGGTNLRNANNEYSDEGYYLESEGKGDVYLLWSKEKLESQKQEYV